MNKGEKFKFSLDDYKENIRKFDTSKCLVSVTGKTNTVTVTILNDHDQYRKRK